MLLCIDTGNTNTIFSVWDGEKFLAHWRISTNHRRTADEYFVWLTTLIEAQKLDLQINACIISATAPRVVFNLRVLCNRYFDTRPLVVGRPDCLLPVAPRVDFGTTVGPDRLVNTVASFDGQKDRQDSHLCRNLELGIDGCRDLTTGLRRYAEITVRDILHVKKKLLSDRLIQIKTLLERRLNLRRLGFLAAERSSRDRIHREECNQTYDEDRCNGKKNSLDNVLEHVQTFLLCKKLSIRFIIKFFKITVNVNVSQN